MKLQNYLEALADTFRERAHVQDHVQYQGNCALCQLPHLHCKLMSHRLNTWSSFLILLEKLCHEYGKACINVASVTVELPSSHI